MKFSEFKRAIQKLPFFSIGHIGALTEKKKLLQNQLSQWEAQGRVIRLRRGLYMLSPEESPMTISKTQMANQLLSPSYVSLEFALWLYGFIPEKVEEITSVTPKKTSYFRNTFGTFHYQHVKPNCFIGFRQENDKNNFPMMIAEPEKAIVDFFYLNLSSVPELSPVIFDEFYRFQNTDGISIQKMKRFAHLFQTKKLTQLVQLFCDYTQERK